jgi:hypothetical protein
MMERTTNRMDLLAQVAAGFATIAAMADRASPGMATTWIRTLTIWRSSAALDSDPRIRHKGVDADRYS